MRIRKGPGTQRQWCGESGKVDNCVVGQHLIYTNNDSKNPFSACVASDLYLPKCWIDDPDRREEAHIPEDAVFRTKWERSRPIVSDGSAVLADRGPESRDGRDQVLRLERFAK